MSRKSNKKGGAKARLGTEDSAKRSAGAVPDEAQSALTGERKGGAKARLGTEDSAKRSAGAAHKTADSYYNTLARLGLGMDNLLSSSAYSTLRVTQNQPLLNALYRNDWIAHRIIDSPAEDMIKNWYQLDTMLSPDYLNQYRKEERRTNVKSKLLSGVKWARLYGGAAGLMMLRNQENLLDQPLDAAAIMPGDFRGIQVVDRWNGVSPSLELVEDPDDDEFGMPAFYNFTLATGGTLRVHHSRVLRFPGREMPYAEQQAENWWGTSELEHVFEEINKRNATSANIAQLVFRANLMVYKKDDMDAFLTSTMNTDISWYKKTHPMW